MHAELLSVVALAAWVFAPSTHRRSLCPSVRLRPGASLDVYSSISFSPLSFPSFCCASFSLCLSVRVQLWVFVPTALRVCVLSSVVPKFGLDLFYLLFLLLLFIFIPFNILIFLRILLNLFLFFHPQKEMYSEQAHMFWFSYMR